MLGFFLRGLAAFFAAFGLSGALSLTLTQTASPVASSWSSPYSAAVHSRQITVGLVPPIPETTGHASHT